MTPPKGGRPPSLPLDKTELDDTAPAVILPKSFKMRLACVDWTKVEARLFDGGAAALGPLLLPDECWDLAASFDNDDRFRKTIDMRRHGFGSGRYRYFCAPPPSIVEALRAAAYARLAPIANRLSEALRDKPAWPVDFSEMQAMSAAAGQTEPTPLLLRYETGDYNCLHQDVYGDVAFPLQLVVQLSAPEQDFTGGEFVVVETRPRMQSRAQVFALRQGEALVFATRHAPRKSAKGWTRSSLRHGVSPVTSGERLSLGVIFHDAPP